MKQLSIILSLFLIAFTACEKDQDMATVAPADQLVAPILASPGSDIVVTVDNLSDVITFKWQRADFGVPTAIEYSLYVQVGAGEPALITAAYGDSMDVKLEDINKKLIAAGAEPDTETDVTFTLTAAIHEAYAKVTSQPVAVKATTFKPLYPDNVYMIGNDFGSWGWGNAGVVDMTPVHSHEGQFWCVRYFNANQGFKWNTVKDWGGDFFSLGTDVGYTEDGGNAVVATSGFYSVYIDYTINKITIEKAKVYGMGDCFGGWDKGQYPFAVNGQTMTITTANTEPKNLRMYASSSAAQGVDWWQMEFNVIDGKIEYRGTGGDQAAVPVDAGKTVTLDFNAGTGTIN
jgi:hypothetical protein